MKNKISRLQKEYVDRIQEDFWPYWQQYDDSIFGGILNCIDNMGATLVSEQKFTWSQGRYLWLLAEMLEAKRNGLLPLLNEGTLQSQLFRVFPDAKHGEWIQIRNREGVPEEKLVALPVKDPFHILRAFLRIIQIPSL